MSAEPNRSIVREYFFKKNQPSWREHSHYQFRKPTTLVEALDNVITCLERHRLMFVHFAAPRNENGMGVEVPCLHEIEWDENDDDEYYHDHFFFDHRKVIEVNLNRIIAQSRPFFFNGDHKFHWSIDDWFSIELEQSCNAIIQSCSYVKEFGNDYGSNLFIENVLSAIHPAGQSKWYSSIQVEWDYPGSLDNVIHQGRLLMAEYPNPETTQIREECNVHKKAIDNRSAFAKRVAFKVFDKDARGLRIYEPKLAEFICGPIEIVEDWDNFSHETTTQYLHLHRDATWTLLTEKWHSQAETPEQVEAERVSPEKAIELLVLNELPIPLPKYAEIADRFMFKPGISKAELKAIENAYKECPAFDDGIDSYYDQVAETAGELIASEELKKGYHDPDNYYRNVYLYGLRKAGLKNREILNQLQTESRSKGFNPLESDTALRDAIEKIAIYHKWPILKGTPGRRAIKET